MASMGLRPVFLLVALAVAGVSAANLAARGEEPASFDVVLQGHRFTPSELHVPAGKPAIIRLKNADDTAEEFDSPALRVEKVVTPGAAVAIRLRPLGPGRFPFSGEFHPDTAQGVVIAE